MSRPRKHRRLGGGKDLTETFFERATSGATMTIAHVLMPTRRVASLTDLPHPVVAMQMQCSPEPVELPFEITTRCSHHRDCAEADEHLVCLGEGLQHGPPSDRPSMWIVPQRGYVPGGRTSHGEEIDDLHSFKTENSCCHFDPTTAPTLGGQRRIREHGQQKG